MRRAWVSVAAGLMLAACGAAPSSTVLVSAPVVGDGLELTLLGADVQDNSLPYLQPPLGAHCAYYTVQARSIDGRRHDLRPSEFEANAGPHIDVGTPVGTPADAVGRCGGPQLEPTWIDSQPRTVVIAILETVVEPAPLTWRPE